MNTVLGEQSVLDVHPILGNNSAGVNFHWNDVRFRETKFPEAAAADYPVLKRRVHQCVEGDYRLANVTRPKAQIRNGT